MSHLTSSLKDFKGYFEFNKIDLKDKNVLDVGCRDNSASDFFNSISMKWSGCDIKPDYPKGNIVECDMTSLHFPNESFDFVFICHSLEHCENPLLALREARRVLKKDGYVFISLPCPCKHHILESDEDHIFCLDERQILRLLKYARFEFTVSWIGGHEGYTGTDRYNVYGVARK